ncbi:ABC transporter substrate-binding protein [Frankia sp. CcI49]|uniref:ABC transporter substrate-binding protein n=1 Tax=unclassified Frankia TaxID=2632575 RepID=UPI0006CA3569|nr:MULTISPECIES: ABC transporter substrate-binding protein [unclassified Frankia]KPM57345.1 ABC transporter substrate-binding protein [Frankia sp. R43]ONH53514.1 ABC transporter substrate-binding protein [Frankia sp. CcI49]
MARRHHRKLRVAGGLVTSAVIALAGCSLVGSADDGASSQKAGCVAPGVTDDEIQIGFVVPDTGPLAKPLAAMRSGFDARIGLANADGGIHGRRIVATARDDESSPATNNEVVRDLIDRKNVFGLVEATTAASGGADYLHDLNIPVAGLPAEGVWSEYQNMFAYSYVFGEGPSVDTFGQYVKARGGTTAAVIRTDIGDAPQDFSSKIVDSLVATGIRILPGPFIWNLNTTTPEAMAQQLKASGADTIIAPISSDELADIMRVGQRIGLKPKVMLAANGYDPSLLARQGNALAGLTTFVNYVPFEARTPSQQIYLNAMSEFAPQLSRPDQELALVSYILTDVFLHGLQLAGPCPTRAGFIDTLRGSKGYNASGLLAGDVDFRNDFGRISSCYSFVQVNDAGTGYDIVRNEAPGAQNASLWCGQRLDH